MACLTSRVVQVLEGGVHICEDMDRVEYVSKRIIGNKLVTKQTGAAGKTVSCLYMAEPIPGIVSEKYFAILMDRTTQGPVMIGSRMGGMNIEDVAKSNPEAIASVPVDIYAGVQDEQLEHLAKKMGFLDSNKELVCPPMSLSCECCA